MYSWPIDQVIVSNLSDNIASKVILLHISLTYGSLLSHYIYDRKHFIINTFGIVGVCFTLCCLKHIFCLEITLQTCAGTKKNHKNIEYSYCCYMDYRKLRLDQIVTGMNMPSLEWESLCVCGIFTYHQKRKSQTDFTLLSIKFPSHCVFFITSSKFYICWKWYLVTQINSKEHRNSNIRSN